MEAFALYLLKSVIWLTGFSLVYLLFLRDERFFMLKRIYLVLGLLVSVFFPLISIHYQVEVAAPVLNPDDFPVAGNTVINPVQQADSAGTFDYRYILFYLYLSGVIMFGFMVIRHLNTLYKTIRKSIKDRRGPAKLIRAPGFPSSFTFFSYIIIDPSVSENEVEEIMNHEMVHVRQKHWFDLLVVELMRLFQWVNPFAWIYTGFIRQNHEYLADAVALQRTSNQANYKAVLVNQLFSSPVISPSNSFNYSLSKKRFDMMKKIIVSPYRKLKMLLVLPVFAIVFYAFATPEYHYTATSAYSAKPAVLQKEVRGTVLNENNKPMQGVSIIVSGTSVGAITDQNGHFVIGNIPDESFLAITFSGHRTMTLKPDFSTDMNIKMSKDTENTDQTPIKVVPAPITKPGEKPQPALLWVIDGVVRKTGASWLDPNNIYHITVLKDKSATDIYGEEGKNGVILVTTKKKDSFPEEVHTLASALSPEDSKTADRVPASVQKQVRGIVLKEDGKPLEGVNITSTGKTGYASGATTGADGRFEFKNVQDDASLFFFCNGYKRLTLKPDFSKEMTVKMERDPEYKAPTATVTQRPDPLVVIDGEISDLNVREVGKALGYNMGISKYIMGKEATDKYGEKGANGVYEITTRKKALEMGLKPHFPRLAPEDYPTFHQKRYFAFDEWVVSQVKYPAEASSKGIQGRVNVNLTVELDGSLSNIKTAGTPDQALADAVLNVIQSSPKWDPPKNSAVDEAYQYSVTIKFTLPDKVSDGKAYVVVEQMPRFPGGDVALLNFIKENTRYPEAAKAEKIEGRVIVRFIVNTQGNAEDLVVLKGVNPLLDAEAIRIVSLLSGWTPGLQDGRPVDVYYMVPVNFSLSGEEIPKQ